MGLFDKDKKKKDDQNLGLFSFINENSDKDLDDYGLEEWEKEEVKKGNHDPWNFEEEETEDDDYYNEDE